MQTIENEGRYWVVKIGERSKLPSLYTNYQEAKRALDFYNSEVKLNQKRLDARKTRSDKGKTKKKEA